MAAKSFTLDGERYKLDPRTPTCEIKWLVGRLSVRLDDGELLQELGIAKRLEPHREHVGGEVLARIIEQSKLYAIKCHRDNQKLYNLVMTY